MTRSPLVALLLALALGCDSLPGRPRAEDRYTPPDEITDFATLYGQSCAGCHGADGTHGPARPLNDPLYLALAGSEVLTRTISHGVPGTAMSPFLESEGGTLTAEQVEAIARGLVAEWGDPKVANAATLPHYSEAASRAAGFQPGDPMRGARAFAAHCADCHGADGGGKTDPDKDPDPDKDTDKDKDKDGDGDGGSVVDPSYLALVSDQGLRTTVIAGRTDLGMPDFRGKQKDRPMSPQDVSDVVAWLAARRVAFPGQPYRASVGPMEEGR